MRTLLYHLEAKLALGEIREWYTKKDEGVFERFIAELRALEIRLRERPEEFEELAPMYRRAMLKKIPYTVLFKHTDTTLEVLLIVHNRRNPKTLVRKILQDQTGRQGNPASFTESDPKP